MRSASSPTWVKIGGCGLRFRRGLKSFGDVVAAYIRDYRDDKRERLGFYRNLPEPPGSSRDRRELERRGWALSIPPETRSAGGQGEGGSADSVG